MDTQKAFNNKDNVDDQIVRFYIWNREHKQFHIKNIKMYLRPGNPQRYEI